MQVFFGVEEAVNTNLGADGQVPSPDLASLMPASMETLYFSRTKGRVNTLLSALKRLLHSKESCTHDSFRG